MVRLNRAALAPCAAFCFAAVLFYWNRQTFRVLEVEIGTSVNRVTEIAILPKTDFALLLSQGGRVILIQKKEDAFLKVAEMKISNIDSTQNCGAFGIAPDAEFGSNNFFYVLHCDMQRLPTITRFTLDSDDFARTAKTASVIFRIEDKRLSAADALFMISNLVQDKAGGLIFGIGDFDIIDAAQDIKTPLGKILRLAPESKVPQGHSIPTDTAQIFAKNIDARILALGVHTPWRIATDNDDVIWFTDSEKNAGSEWNRLTENIPNYGWGAEKCDSCESPILTTSDLSNNLPLRNRWIRLWKNPSSRIGWIGPSIASGDLSIADWCSGDIFSLREDFSLQYLGTLPVVTAIAPIGNNTLLGTYSDRLPASCGDSSGLKRSSILYQIFN